MNPYEKDYNSKKAEYERAKNLIDKASKGVLTPAQQSLLSQYKDKFKTLESEYLSAKQKYESWTGQANVGTDQGGQVTPTQQSIVYHTAPNGKAYTITRDGKSASFININGQIQSFPTIEQAKNYIDSKNPASQVDKSVTQQAQSNVEGALQTTIGGLQQTQQEGLAGQQNIQTQLGATGDKIQQTETDILGMIDASFQSAKGALTAAQDLEVEAENIYGQAQIQSQYEDLIRKGLNPAKAKQASLFVNLKGRANLSAKIATIKANVQKTIAELEMKKADLIVQAKSAGIENQKWMLEQASAIETNVNAIKNQYNTQVVGLEQTYRINPLLNVYSTTLEADVKNVAQNIQTSYDTSSNQGKITALARVLGDSFAYIDGSIYNYMTLPFDQLLIKAVEIVRKNNKK